MTRAAGATAMRSHAPRPCAASRRRGARPAASASTSARGSAAVIARDVEREADVGASAGSRRRAALGSRRSHVEAELRAQRELALERLGLVAVARDDERAAAAQARIGAGGLLELGGEAPASRARCAGPSASSASSPASASVTGASIPAATCEAPRAELAALEHADAQPALRRAPGDGEPDHAPADDGDVEVVAVGSCGMCTSLRRHDPDQLLTVGIDALSARARRAPVWLPV